MSSLREFLGATGVGVALTVTDLDNLKRTMNPRVLVVRGDRMRTKQALLNELSAALQFPLVFGNNWDALADCLNDLEWLGGPTNVVLGIARASHVLADDAAALATFVSVLANRGPRVLLTVDQPEEAEGVLAAWSEVEVATLA